MDTRQITIVKESFEKVKPYSNKLTRVFYDYLFELDPSLRKLFKRDLRTQRRKFVTALTFIIDNLHDAKKTGPYIKELARKHLEYNVKEKDYETFGKALVFALSAALGNDFTPSVKDAWQNSYSTLAKIMVSSSYR